MQFKSFVNKIIKSQCETENESNKIEETSNKKESNKEIEKKSKNLSTQSATALLKSANLTVERKAGRNFLKGENIFEELKHNSS